MKKSEYLNPTRIIFASENIENPNFLLSDVPSQPMFINMDMCKMFKGSSVVLDFGKEINGTIRITSHFISDNKTAKIHIRFGESVSECMAEIGEKNAGNDHAPRDIELPIGLLSTVQYGDLGFRFVRIDVLNDVELEIQNIQAIFVHDASPQLGSFECNDELLNNIWKTGAYTVHLNMQDYLFDGVKRDRLVWIGDMHPEVSTLMVTYGNYDVVPKSLDFVKNSTPPTQWMNGIATYSMWWIIIIHDWYMRWGDYEYLSEQKDYLMQLCENAIKFVNGGFVSTEEMECFVDWSSKDTTSEIEGVKSIFCIGLKYAAKLFEILQDTKTAEKCLKTSEKIEAQKCGMKVNKRIAALNVLANRNTEYEYKLLSGSSADEMSCFMGYYILIAKAKLGEHNEIMDVIRKYWGGMLDMGATTFWEDFDISWMDNSYCIDELPVRGKRDIHGDFGKYCYKQFRHSLCHGWASGVTAFMSQHILGIEILEPGCKKVKIKPNLCGLKWVKGKFPTPYGEICVEAYIDTDNQPQVKIVSPKEIEVECE